MKQLTFGLIFFFTMSITSCNKELKDDGVMVPLTVLEDPSIPSIVVNNVVLHSESFGNPLDPMLVVLHGGPGADYRSQLNYKQLVDDGMYVVFYDQRGSGLSERISADRYSEVQVFVDELQGVIDHYQSYNSQKLVLAGHSWGAMLATAYINQNPDKVAGAILAEPGGFTWTQTESYIQASRKLELTSETTNDFVYQDQFITGSDHNSLDYKMALSLAGDIATGDVVAPSYWRLGAVCSTASINLAINNPEQMNFTNNLSAYNTKVLFAYSELNIAYGRDHAELVSSEYSNVALIEIPGCGHEIPQFGWTNFYPNIQSYLNEIL